MESSVYLITFVTYGSHLPGDNAIVDRHHNAPGSPYAELSDGWLYRSERLMRDPPYLLEERRRAIVLAALQEVCQFRQWRLLAAHVRTNHVHAVVDASATPEQVMSTLKAYASRALNRFEPAVRRHWARHGSTRHLWNHAAISAAISYVTDGQGTPMAVFHEPPAR
jgi:REP element-mobilizing transposase RayT